MRVGRTILSHGLLGALVVASSGCRGTSPTAPWLDQAQSQTPASVTIPITLNNVAFAAPALVGGGSTQGTVSLTVPAPAGGAVVALSSSDAAGAVPATVTVPAGATSASFAITTREVTRDTVTSIRGAFPPSKIVQAPLSVWAVLPTSFYWFSEPGESIAHGGWGRLNAETATFSGYCDASAVTVNINGGGLETWTVGMSAVLGSPLRPGVYENATSFFGGFTNRTQPELGISGRGSACSSTGRFVIEEVQLTAGGGISRLVATFEQRCGNNQGSRPLIGEIRVVNISPSQRRDRPCLL